ncbi:hypothetical protein U1701_07505 [Sphingomonas sp. PB2P19]|uniref:hypothetical protein n=1 Tax=Sphingomonas rhamnosi TaxID=3096156 RepID=UPI002FC7EA68
MQLDDRTGPAGWPTASDEDNTVNYLGLKVTGWRYDVVARGAAIDIDALGYVAGKTRTELRGSGLGAYDFIGSNAGLTWTGKAGCFDIVKVKAIAGGAIRETVTLTNARCGTLTDVRYMHAIDPDQDASQENVFRITARGTVVATPKKAGPTVTLSSADPRATAFGIPNLLLPRAYNVKFDALRKIAAVTKGDGDAILLFRLGTMAAGASVTVSYGIAMTP